jgi:hypothetical protein
VVLCTQDKTYNLRQVSTSNSVFVAQSSTNTTNDLHGPGLEAIAQCTSTLELQPDKTASAVPYIKAGVPTFTSLGNSASAKPVSKRQLFANIPLCHEECEQAWTELACFEIDGGAFLPSTTVKADAWKAMLTFVNAAGIDLTAPLTAEDRIAMVENGNEWPMELNLAILESAYAPLIETTGSALDGDKLALLVGVTILRQSSNEGNGWVPVERLESAWADMLPEKWRSKAQLSILGGNYKRENDSVSFTDRTHDSSEAASANASTEAKSTLGAKRKWHEKFRAQKKTA